MRAMRTKGTEVVGYDMVSEVEVGKHTSDTRAPDVEGERLLDQGVEASDAPMRGGIRVRPRVW